MNDALLLLAQHGFTVLMHMSASRVCGYSNKMLSYRRETALQGTLVLARSGRLELGDNILRTL